MSGVPGPFLGVDEIDGREVRQEHRVAPETFLLVDAEGDLWLVSEDSLEQDEPVVCIPEEHADAFQRAVNMVVDE